MQANMPEDKSNEIQKYQEIIKRMIERKNHEINEHDWTVFIRKVLATVPGDSDAKRYEWISKQTDISISTFQNWVSDRPNKAGKKPSSENLSKIAKLLDISFADLVILVQWQLDPPSKLIGGFGPDEIRLLAQLKSEEIPIFAKQLAGITQGTLMMALSNLSLAARYVAG